MKDLWRRVDNERLSTCFPVCVGQHTRERGIKKNPALLKRYKCIVRVLLYNITEKKVLCTILWIITQGRASKKLRTSSSLPSLYFYVKRKQKSTSSNRQLRRWQKKTPKWMCETHTQQGAWLLHDRDLSLSSSFVLWHDTWHILPSRQYIFITFHSLWCRLDKRILLY